MRRRPAKHVKKLGTGNGGVPEALPPPPSGNKLACMTDVSLLLDAAAAGDRRAAADLLPLVYDELRALAAARMAHERPGQTLDATALVHEAYVRLLGPADAPKWANQAHFFAAAAEAMRRILVEAARRKGRVKHGGGRRREPADPDQLCAADSDGELLDLDESLERFAAHDPLKAKLVELHFFAGLTLAQAAECLGVSLSTADRGWRYARAWLYADMGGNQSATDTPHG